MHLRIGSVIIGNLDRMDLNERRIKMIQNYEVAKKIIEENEELGDFVGQIPEDVIEKAESLLGLELPKNYKQFIRDFGAGNFGSEEVYGILSDNFENSGIPDAVWFTIKQRKELQLPFQLVAIYFTGGEEYFCLDTSKINEDNECPVISYVIGSEMESDFEIIAEDFSDFFLNIVRREIGN